MKSSNKPTRTGRQPLRPRARIVRAIGEDLISNEIIALVELIKNAYDADASEVTITFEPPLKRGRGALVVKDDGRGMTLKILRNAWFEPATVSKRQNRLSPRRRRVTGEKGLGRFAAARLADRIHLDSVAARPRRRVTADLNWGEFRKLKLYLDEVECEWSEFDVQRGTPTGTTLRLSELRDDWSNTSFRRLRAELARLVARPENEDPFNIVLRLPAQFREHEGQIRQPAILGKPHYTLRGQISDSGSLSAKGTIGREEVQVKELVKLKDGGTPACGPFTFEFRVWDRDRDSLGDLATKLSSTLRDLRGDLDEASGLSIYRDSFRVLPYGGAGDDWLRLDLRRVQNPTLRLSNNQIVGAIYITADGNPDLRDQTNREGLVESVALEDLKECVKAVLVHIEHRRYKARRPHGRAEVRRPLFDDLGIEKIAASFRNRYPKDKEFRDFLKGHAKKARSSIKRVQEVIVRYRRLATLGQLVDVILHDGRTPVSSISNECVLLRRDIQTRQASSDVEKQLLPRLDTIEKQSEVLSALFRRIAPFGGRKRGRPKEQPLETLVSDAFAIYRTQLKDLGIRTVLPHSKTPVTVDAAEMQQIVVNLLDNAIYWLRMSPPEQRAIAVEVRRCDGALEMLFADSGPGVPEDVRDNIFDPYFSTKPDGVGLGLTIAGETVAEYDGTLELVPARLLPGANFRVTLRRRIGQKMDKKA